MCIWWKCGKLNVVWRQVHAIIQMMLENELPWTPRVMMLADMLGIAVANMKTIIVNMLAAASMLIASKWKTPDIPTVNEWLTKVRFMGLLAKKLSAVCRYNLQVMWVQLIKFTQQWGLPMLSNFLGFSRLNIHAEILAILWALNKMCFLLCWWWWL